jgi:hypothetical protein
MAVVVDEVFISEDDETLPLLLFRFGLDEPMVIWKFGSS